MIHESGEVKGKAGKKAATSDWMSMEQERGISITSSVLQFDHQGQRINLLDTPGHKDFSEDTYRTLVAADTALMLIDVAKGVEERTKKLYEVCSYRKIPIFTFINKCDREGKQPLELLGEIENTLKMKCYPVNWPLGLGDLFKGLYDRFQKKVILYNKKTGEQTPIPVDSLEDPRWKEWIHPDLLETVLEEIGLIELDTEEFSMEAFKAGHLSPAFLGHSQAQFWSGSVFKLFQSVGPRANPSGQPSWGGPPLRPPVFRFYL